MGNVDHHIAGADDGHMFAHVKRTVAETGQSIEVVHNVFGMKHALRRVPSTPMALVPCAPMENTTALAPRLEGLRR